MKYLLLVAIALVVFWLLRSRREAEKTEKTGGRDPQQRPRQEATKPAEMVACSVCGVHLPRSDALIGSKGIYCSEAHRRQAKG